MEINKNLIIKHCDLFFSCKMRIRRKRKRTKEAVKEIDLLENRALGTVGQMLLLSVPFIKVKTWHVLLFLIHLRTLR